MGVHPCRSSQDKSGNPRYKMHAIEGGSELTICGLEVADVNRRHQYTSLCPVCWPREPAPTELPWDPEFGGNEGERIGSRFDEEDL